MLTLVGMLVSACRHRGTYIYLTASRVPLGHMGHMEAVVFIIIIIITIITIIVIIIIIKHDGWRDGLTGGEEAGGWADV